ncbi:MAG: DEAD/DEAH box helicase, partial [Desulfobacteraceae bacterium]
MNFDCFNFDPRIISGVNALGYTQPTPIQQEAIPPILAGRDVMGIAQTGTGKTAAFVLPILQRLMPGRRSGVRALVIAPTRELTEQTLQSTRQLGRKTGLTCVSIYGGAGMQSQVDALRRGVDIVSACPGRLLDHVRRKTINLSQVEVLVLDEADQMFDMGFLPDIRAILKHLPSGRQTLLFSATMPPEIDALAGDTLRDPVRVQIGRPAPAATVSHTFCPVETQAKNSLLQQILNTAGTGLVLVFTRTKQRSKRVAQQLEASGFEAAAL